MESANGPASQVQHIREGSYGFQTSTPPPPPPKPNSGTGTPSLGPPLPRAPDGGANAIGSPAFGANSQPMSSTYQQLPLPEAGWLPPGVSDKSTQDLQYLLQHPEMQNALVDNPETSHPSISQAQGPLEQLLESNIALADRITQLQTQLVAQRSATQSRLLGLRALEQQHRSKISETETELRGFSPMALYQRLNASVQEQDSLVRSMEDSFVDESGMATDREVQDFVRRVREAKKTAFLRNERKMRWDEGRVGGWR